ncbi:MAG: hypothetical protein MPW14_07825 [Candidatus Manganitrophus sp.]|nr:MAG: hypothetical protein MPW14_07825 [Candidatus Manganitrophus sp.]
MQHLLKKILLLFLLLSACSADPFPDCCIDQGERRDAPFSTTFLSQFKTGSSDIVAPNPDQFLRIITEADIMTLMNSAATSQLNRNGLIGGVVQGSQGPAREAAIQVTDAEGNIIGHATGTSRNLFYNSLGRIPDLTIDQGTSLEEPLRCSMSHRGRPSFRSFEAGGATAGSPLSPGPFPSAESTLSLCFQNGSACWGWRSTILPEPVSLAPWPPFLEGSRSKKPMAPGSS